MSGTTRVPATTAPTGTVAGSITAAPVRAARLAAAVRVIVSATLCGTLTWFLTALEPTLPGAPFEARRVGHWLIHNPPDAVAARLVWGLALLLAVYLTALHGVAVVALVCRSATLLRGVDRAGAGLFRRLGAGALSAGLCGTAVAAPAGAGVLDHQPPPATAGHTTEFPISRQGFDAQHLADGLHTDLYLADPSRSEHGTGQPPTGQPPTGQPDRARRVIDESATGPTGSGHAPKDRWGTGQNRTDRYSMVGPDMTRLGRQDTHPGPPPMRLVTPAEVRSSSGGAPTVGSDTTVTSSRSSSDGGSPSPSTTGSERTAPEPPPGHSTSKMAAGAEATSGTDKPAAAPSTFNGTATPLMRLVENPARPQVPAPATLTPTGTSSEPSSWVVRPGDNLWDISAEVQGSAGVWDETRIRSYWLEMIEANRDQLSDPDNPDLLFVGQQLRLPPTGAGG